METNFKKPNAVSSFLIILICIMIWYVAPHLQLSGAKPFITSGARILLIIFITLILFLKTTVNFILKENHNIKKLAIAYPQYLSKLLLISKKFANNIIYTIKQFINTIYQPPLIRDNKLLLYLILGAQKSGKKSLIENSGIHILQNHSLNREYKHYFDAMHHVKWWFTDQALLIDPSHQDESFEHEPLTTLIRFLKKKKSNQPLNGVLITFKIVDLLLNDNQTTMDIHLIANQLRTLYRTLKTKIPIYIVFTHCDLISGFNEFFNNLSKEEITQIWGTTFPINDCSEFNSLIPQISSEYDNLLLGLHRRILWALDIEKSATNRERLAMFPHQIQLFKTKIITLISTLIESCQYPRSLQIRGFYFTSALQENVPCDPLNILVGNPLGLAHDPLPPQRNTKESYFISKLFYDVIFQEGQYLGWSNPAMRFKKYSYRLSCILIPVVIGLSIYIWSNAFQSFHTITQQISQNIIDFKTQQADFNPENDSITPIIPSLDLLNNAYLDTLNGTKTIGLFFATYQLRLATHDALIRTIHALLLPRIAAELEKKLSQNDFNENLLYALMKGYLAFSPSDYADASAIIAPMEYNWSSLAHTNINLLNQLKYYLKMATRTRLDQLPLNRPLIENVRLRLQQINPTDRALGLLIFKSAESDIADLDLNATGDNFSQIFENAHSIIPALYTQTGYDQVFLKDSAAIARQVAEDNHDIGLITHRDIEQAANNILMQLKLLYLKNYQNQWIFALNSIKVKKITNLAQAIETLQVLSSKESPLIKIISIVTQNMGNINNGDIPVTPTILLFNQYETSEKNQQLQQSLVSLKNYFSNLSQSTNINEAEFKALQSFINGQTDNPLRALIQSAANAPEPIKSWMNSLAQQCFQILATGTMNYINNAWTSQIIPLFNQQLSGRFPLDPQANTDLSLDSFTQFFSPNGILKQFFNNYLSRFINTQTNPWQIRQVERLGLNLDPISITLFEQADKIQRVFFNANSRLPEFNFSITPEILDNNASTLNLTVGGQQLNYSHGPQTAISLTWPFPATNQSSKAIINNFSDQHYVLEFFGPWSIFRLLSQSHYIQRQDGSFDIDFTLGGYYASFLIKNASSIESFRLLELKGFSLPEQLTQVAYHANSN